MSNELNKLMNAARVHIETRMETNTLSQQALQAWREQLRNLMGAITSWVHPLHDLDNFSIKQTEVTYRVVDPSNRKSEVNGTGLKLTFADTELLIAPAYFTVGGSAKTPMISTGAVQMLGNGLDDSCQILYFNGSFDKMTDGPQEMPFGEYSFLEFLASVVPRLKPDTAQR